MVLGVRITAGGNSDCHKRVQGPENPSEGPDLTFLLGDEIGSLGKLFAKQ